MALIVGLGNPGQEYEGTRHNIGFELIDTLSDQLKIPLKPGNGPFIIGEGRFKGQNVFLLKPATFMNHSGKAVTKVLAATGESADNCIICYDDINLDVGTIRLRPSGSAGGHNGLADILNRLGTQQISRLRIGIGNNFSKGKQVDYVLSPFSPEQRIEINQVLEVASDAILTFLRGGINLAMNEFN
jgi:PTH1 family peptidyl-tRNA hydrolase